MEVELSLSWNTGRTVLRPNPRLQRTLAGACAAEPQSRSTDDFY